MNISLGKFAGARGEAWLEKYTRSHCVQGLWSTCLESIAGYCYLSRNLGIWSPTGKWNCLVLPMATVYLFSWDDRICSGYITAQRGTQTDSIQSQKSTRMTGSLWAKPRPLAGRFAIKRSSVFDRPKIFPAVNTTTSYRVRS